MKKRILTSLLSLVIPVLAQAQCNSKTASAESCCVRNKSKELSCKLTSKELHDRKKTIIASLNSQVKERKELANGYAFRFDGNDALIDELIAFVKTERRCCDFFVFDISISGDRSEAWLQLTGPEGAKDFVTEELGM